MQNSASLQPLEPSLHCGRCVKFFPKNGRSTIFISGVVVEDRSFVRLPYSNGTTVNALIMRRSKNNYFCYATQH